MHNKKYYILSGVLILVLGLILTISDAAEKNIIHFFGTSLNKQLNETFWSIGFEHAGVELILIASLLFLFIFFFNKYPNQTLIISSSAWIMSFLIYVIIDTVNIPFRDDYFFLRFLNNYTISRDLCEIFSQNNESRLIFMKALGVMLFYLHSFNFKILTMVANLCLIGSLLLLFKSINLEIKNKMFLLLALTILIFQFEFYDSSVWAAGALYSSCTIFFSFTAIYFLTSRILTGFLLSLVFAVLSVMSCGVGFITLAIGLFILVSKKRIQECIIWAVTATILFIFYFHNYSFAQEHYCFGFSFEIRMDRIITCILFSFTFLGSPTQFLYQTTSPMILGAFIWIFFLFLTYKKYFTKNSTIYYMLLFILLTSLIPAVFRQNITIHEGINMRYGIYSIMAISCCMIALTEIINTQKFKMFIRVALPLFITFHLLTSIFFYPEVILRKEQMVTMIQNFKRTGVPSMSQPYSQYVADDAKFLLNECGKKNIYKIPD